MKQLAGTAMVIALLAAGPALAQSTTPQTRQNAASAGTSTPQKLDSQDRSFVTKAAEGGVSEVKLGQLALDKASNPHVKQFSQKMIDDHKKADRQLRQALAEDKVAFPDHMSSDAANTYDKLAKESGKNFDQDYMQAMISDHQKDVSAFEDEAKNGKDQSLKQYAENTLPILRQHLQTAKNINNQLSKQQ